MCGLGVLAKQIPPSEETVDWLELVGSRYCKIIMGGISYEN